MRYRHSQNSANFRALRFNINSSCVAVFACHCSSGLSAAVGIWRFHFRQHAFITRPHDPFIVPNTTKETKLLYSEQALYLGLGTGKHTAAGVPAEKLELGVLQPPAQE